MNIIPTLEPAHSKTDWAKKLMLTFVFIIFILIIEVLFLGIIQNPMFLTLDTLTMTVITILPTIFALFGVYAIFKADFVAED